ncbi:MAG: N-acetylmuramoyl-L-alanine amidase [Chitinophagaceae bacterium]
MVLKTIVNKGRVLCGLVLLFTCFGFASLTAVAQESTKPQQYIKDGQNGTDTTLSVKDTIVEEEPIKDSAVLAYENYVAKGRFAKANRLYFEMIDSMAKVILEYPIRDSAGLPYATDWVGTPNMGLRRPNYVIIHHTATSNCNAALQEFTTPGGREASAHYVISKDGTVYHMLNDLLRSHHAGESKWGNTTDLNSSSIGIELDNNGYQPFTEAQINSLMILLGRLKTTYKIPDANFIGHGDIAPARKMDPNWRFPWRELSEKGFGLWWGDTTNVKVPDNFDYLMGLRIIGYDISAPASAVAAFKRHFMKESSGTMNAAVRKIIYVLYRKFE